MNKKCLFSTVGLCLVQMVWLAHLCARGCAHVARPCRSSRAMTERGKGSVRDAHMGPLRLPNGQGTLTASDRHEIWRRYKVSASVRYRQQWGERCLSLSGEAGNLNAARDYALQKIDDNGDGGCGASHNAAGAASDHPAGAAGPRCEEPHWHAAVFGDKCAAKLGKQRLQPMQQLWRPNRLASGLLQKQQ